MHVFGKKKANLSVGFFAKISAYLAALLAALAKRDFLRAAVFQ